MRVRPKPNSARDADGKLTSAYRSKAAVRAVIVLIALLALWGYLRGLGGQVGGVMERHPAGCAASGGSATGSSAK